MASATSYDRARSTILRIRQDQKRKQLQRDREKIKEKLASKAKEAELLARASVDDYRKKTQKKTAFEQTDMTHDSVIGIAREVSEKELPNYGEGDFAKVTFQDGKSSNLDIFSAKRIASCHALLGDDEKVDFERMLNTNPETFMKARDFAIRYA